MKHSRIGRFALMFVLTAVVAPAQGRLLKAFTVAEEIGVSLFLRPAYSEAAIVSPNGRFVVLQPAERGLLLKDVVEDELRVYDVTALKNFVLYRGNLGVPAPLLDLRESTFKEGPIIRQIQWLPDSRGLAFLLRGANGKYQLVTVSLREGRQRVMSLPGQDVTTFDVRDSAHYAYAVFSPENMAHLSWETGWTSIVDTGLPLSDLLLPSEYIARLEAEARENGLRSTLWAADGNKPHLVISRESGLPIVINPMGRWLALSPDGGTLVTAVPVPEVPEHWVRTFRPPSPDYPLRMRAGHQNLNAPYSAGALVSEYVLIDLRTGTIKSVNGAPTGIGNGWWWEVGGPVWSADGKAVLLPNTYPQPAGGRHSVAQPCAAIFYPATDTMQCLKQLESPRTKEGGSEQGLGVFGPLRFVDGNPDRVILDSLGPDHQGGQLEPTKTEEYKHMPNGRWESRGKGVRANSQRNWFKVYIRQGLNDPPVAVVGDYRTEVSRVFWNPNPQLRNIALGEATTYRWKDATGRVWTGGLYKPANFIKGRRYPLVIQTHGFQKDEFRPSGMYPTAFAARALAASGIVVLQTPMMCVLEGTKEGPCNVSGFEGAVHQLSADGVVDANRVGIIGFSRTVYYALEALTTSRVPYAAASVTDGETYGYFQYLVFLNESQDSEARLADATIGAKPFGAGLRVWLTCSPEFNMQRVHTPLLLVTLGRHSLLSMWEPYAVLRYLRRPVTLMTLNSDEHVLTNPAVRMASQGGSVDWFRFWLQGYEDIDPAKASQYHRWEELCDLQRAQTPGHPTFCRAKRN